MAANADNSEPMSSSAYADGYYAEGDQDCAMSPQPRFSGGLGSTAQACDDPIDVITDVLQKRVEEVIDAKLVECSAHLRDGIIAELLNCNAELKSYFHCRLDPVEPANEELVESAPEDTGECESYPMHEAEAGLDKIAHDSGTSDQDAENEKLEIMSKITSMLSRMIKLELDRLEHLLISDSAQE